MKMRVHKLKTWPPFFEQVQRGEKKAEVRKSDRDFQVGDYLCLMEFDPIKDNKTGRYDWRRISHILTPADPPRCLMEGHVVLSLEEVDSDEIAHLTGQYRGALTRTVEIMQPGS